MICRNRSSGRHWDSRGGKIDPETSTADYAFWDTNRDGRVSASDALVVINQISRNEANAESELVLAMSKNAAAVSRHDGPLETTIDNRHERVTRVSLSSNLSSATASSSQFLEESTKREDAMRASEDMDELEVRDQLLGNWNWNALD